MSPARPERTEAGRALRRSLRRRPAAGLGWGLMFFAGLQAFLIFQVEGRPELRDPQFGYRLLALRERLAAEPDRPLVLLLGSSRVELGFRPEALPGKYVADGPAPLVFNFALTANGSLEELLHLRRLLAQGIHPRLVVVEVFASLLSDAFGEADHFRDGAALSRQDLAVLRPYYADPAGVSRLWLGNRLLSGITCRNALLTEWAPSWLPWESRTDIYRAVQDRSGWVAWQGGNNNPTAQERRRAREWARVEHHKPLGDFRLFPARDQALHDLLTLCADEGIQAALLLMPEGRTFQALYSPRTRRFLDAYCVRLHEDYGVPIIDARDWVAEEDFADGHHLLARGADVFTRRFGREALRPLLNVREKTTAARAGARGRRPPSQVPFPADPKREG